MRGFLLTKWDVFTDLLFWLGRTGCELNITAKEWKFSVNIKHPVVLKCIKRSVVLISSAPSISLYQPNSSFVIIFTWTSAPEL